MPRKARFNLPGVPQHVIQRGNNREPCFFSETDYIRYLEDLQTAADKHQCQIHAYVLMTNHVHLLVTPFKDYGVSLMMQSLGRRYVKYINHTYQRTGTLWEGRYKASLVDSEMYLLTCMRYIESNPVRASMVEHPGDYMWSSYAANAYGRLSFNLKQHPLYRSLGKNSEQRQEAYRELFNIILDKESLHDIRDTLNHELVLGRSYFKDRVEKMTQRQVRLGQPGRPRIEEEEGEYFVY